MSNVLYPTLAGLTWDTTKTPLFSTGVQTAVDLSELRVSYSATPIYDVVLAYDLLRDDSTWNEFRTIFGFVLARYGSWDSFLYADPDDSIALLEPFGTGDGVTTAFQLKRAMGAFTEPVKNIAAAPSIYKAAVLQSTGYSISATGLVTFGAAPANGAALTWSGTYYLRCRFDVENTPFALNQFMRRMWELKQVEFRGSLGTKI